MIDIMDLPFNTVDHIFSLSLSLSLSLVNISRLPKCNTPRLIHNCDNITVYVARCRL